MGPVVVALGTLFLLSGTAWSAPCDGASNRKACLEREKARLEYELSRVEEELEKADEFWLSLDLGLDVVDGLYASVGISFPLGPLYISPGLWAGSAYDEHSLDWGWFVTLGYSFTLVE